MQSKQYKMTKNIDKVKLQLRDLIFLVDIQISVSPIRWRTVAQPCHRTETETRFGTKIEEYDIPLSLSLNVMKTGWTVEHSYSYLLVYNVSMSTSKHMLAMWRDIDIQLALVTDVTGTTRGIHMDFNLEFVTGGLEIFIPWSYLVLL